jgi:hypothetical protein
MKRTRNNNNLGRYLEDPTPSKIIENPRRLEKQSTSAGWEPIQPKKQREKNKIGSWGLTPVHPTSPVVEMESTGRSPMITLHLHLQYYCMW